MADNIAQPQPPDAKPKPLFSVEKNANFNPPWVIRVDPTPGGVPVEGGGRKFSLIFPMLQATEMLNDPEKVLGRVAEILNLHWGDE